MEIYQYLKTIINLLFAFLTEDILTCVAVVFFGFLVLWAILAVVFSYETDFKYDCLKVSYYIKEHKVTRNNYIEFTSLFMTMSTSVRRCWKAYELCVDGMPSDYLKLNECLDMPVSGGIKKQTGSFMNFVINSFVTILAICSLAIFNVESAVFTVETILQSLVMPLIFLFVCKLVYYIYISARNHEYRLAVESFNDMVDLLDERVSLAEIFEGYEDAISLVSNVYSNETLNKLKLEENAELLKKMKIAEKLKKQTEIAKLKEDRMLSILQERERADIEQKMLMIDKLKESLPEEMSKQEEIDRQKNEDNEAFVQRQELQEVVEENQKRGRGRPRKLVDIDAVQKEKRGRGRPRKIIDENEIQKEKRGRGRPRKPVADAQAESAIEESILTPFVNQQLGENDERSTILKDKENESKITNQRQFIAAMNELEALLDKNSVPTISSEELEANNKRIDELVEKMMTYKQNLAEGE